MKYTFRGETPKSLPGTTPPHEVLNPGDVFEVAETLEGAEFEPVKSSAKSDPPKEVTE